MKTTKNSPVHAYILLGQWLVIQCLSIPIIDNNVCDGDRAFRVTLATFDPLFQVIPGQENLTVEIMDDESTLYSLILGCLWVLYLHYL